MAISDFQMTKEPKFKFFKNFISKNKKEKLFFITISRDIGNIPKLGFDKIERKKKRI